MYFSSYVVRLCFIIPFIAILSIVFIYKNEIKRFPVGLDRHSRYSVSEGSLLINVQTVIVVSCCTDFLHVYKKEAWSPFLFEGEGREERGVGEIGERGEGA